MIVLKILLPLNKKPNGLVFPYHPAFQFHTISPCINKRGDLPVLVSEVSHSGKHHYHIVFVSSINYFLISDGTARLNYALNTACRSGINAVSEREECI